MAVCCMPDISAAGELGAGKFRSARGTGAAIAGTADGGGLGAEGDGGSGWADGGGSGRRKRGYARAGDGGRADGAGEG